MFRTIFSGLVFTNLAFSVVFGAEAVDPSGNWEWAATNGNGRKAMVHLQLRLIDGKLVGELSIGKTEPVPIADGRVKGNKVSFSVRRTQPNARNKEIHSQYEGALEGEVISGTATIERDGSRRSMKWEATRELHPESEPSSADESSGDVPQQHDDKRQTPSTATNKRGRVFFGTLRAHESVSRTVPLSFRNQLPSGDISVVSDHDSVTTKVVLADDRKSLIVTAAFVGSAIEKNEVRRGTIKLTAGDKVVRRIDYIAILVAK